MVTFRRCLSLMGLCVNKQFVTFSIKNWPAAQKTVTIRFFSVLVLAELSESIFSTLKKKALSTDNDSILFEIPLVTILDRFCGKLKMTEDGRIICNKCFVVFIKKLPVL